MPLINGKVSVDGGWMNRKQQEVIEYLQVEDQVLQKYVPSFYGSTD